MSRVSEYVPGYVPGLIPPTERRLRERARLREDRRRWRMDLVAGVAALVALLVLCVLLAGCATNKIDPAAIETTFQLIRERHDRYVNADVRYDLGVDPRSGMAFQGTDPKAMGAAQRERDLRDTALLWSLIEQALGKDQPATKDAVTAPAEGK
jgi:hypothetical protein